MCPYGIVYYSVFLHRYNTFKMEVDTQVCECSDCYIRSFDCSIRVYQSFPVAINIPVYVPDMQPNHLMASHDTILV